MTFPTHSRLWLYVLVLCMWCIQYAQGNSMDSIYATANRFRDARQIDSVDMQQFADNCIRAGAAVRFMEVYDTASQYTGAWSERPHDISFLEQMDSILQKQHKPPSLTAYRVHLYLTDIYSFFLLKSSPALMHIDKAINIAGQLKDTCRIIEAFILKSHIYTDVMNNDLQAGMALNEADRLAKQMGYKSFCNCDAPYEIDYATLYQHLENYQEAIQYLNAAIKRFTDKTENGTKSQNGRLYYIHFYKAAISIEAGIYNTVSEDINQAQRYAAAAPDPRVMFNSLNSLRFIAWYLQGNKTAADSIAVFIDPSMLDNTGRNSINYLYYLTRLRIDQHRLQDAQKTLRDFEQSQDSHVLIYYVYLNTLSYLLAREKHDFPAAVGYLELTDKYKDSLHLTALKKAAVSEQIHYQTIQKEEHIRLQESELNNSRQKIKIILASGSTLLLLLLLIFMYRRNRNMREKNRMIQSFTRQLIDSREQEQNRLAHEMHDGIGQELMLIRNSLQSQKDNKHAAMLTDSIENIRAISRNLFPALLESIGLKIALEQLLHQVDDQYDLFVTSEINYENRLDKYIELQLFRITQEALNNTLKYAHARSVKVVLQQAPEYVLLEIQDNGTGFDVSETMKRNTGVGLMSMQQRAQAINASFLLKSEKQKGTLITVKLSL